MPDPQSTRERLLNAARHLFARHGYEAVSMRELAEAVGLRQSAIYNHFDSKQALLADLMTSHMERVLTAMEAAIAPLRSPTEQLTAFCRFHVDNHIDHPQDVFLAYMELRSLTEPTLSQVIGLRDRYEARLRDILAKGQSTSAFAPADPAILARALLAMLTGVTTWYKKDGPAPREAVVSSYVKAALGAAGALTPR